MAPRQILSRIQHRQPTHSRSSHANSTLDTKSPTGTVRDSSFTGSRSDKRQIRRSLLLSKAALSSDRQPSRIAKTSVKRKERLEKQRRRESLAADLGSLVDVLETSAASQDAKIVHAGSSSSQATLARAVASRNKSIKSKSGMQKRKADIALLERQRMGKNMTIMSEAKPGTSTEPHSSDLAASRAEKWAALRRHIVMAGSMEEDTSLK